MSAVQVTIPFKSRKKTYVNTKQCRQTKDDIENKVNNSITIKKSGTIKKHKIYDEELNKTTDDKESCSPQKRCRRDIKEIKAEDKLDKKIIEPPRRPLTSREAEIGELETFLQEHLDTETSGSMYVSGQPGTGKTASLNYVLSLTKFQENYKQIYINCTMMKSAASIYNRICKELQVVTHSTSEKSCLTAIEKYLKKKHKMIVIVLDEIDQLDSRRQSVLYTVFGWSGQSETRLVLVGVANALDLTQRVLPRLQTKHLRPRTLHFAPYTKAQILNIFTTILAEEDKMNVFSPVALQMLAAKISAISGDMRRALDIGRRVIEVARRNRLKENGLAVKEQPVTVELKEVLHVLNDVYGGSDNINVDVEQGLPMQQKLILCTIMLMLTKGNKNEILLGKLHDVYKRVASNRNIGCLDMGELVSACGLLEERGAVQLGRGVCARGRKVRLLWDRATLQTALNDQPLLAHILNQTSALNA